MATRSHSRFTDDVFCIPAPTTSKISVNTVDQLRDDIFESNDLEDFRNALHSAESMQSVDLYEHYPPKFTNQNKKIIFDKLNNDHHYKPLPGKDILITRWKPFILIIEKSKINTEVEYEYDLFEYQSKYDQNVHVEWYLNFANSDLFAYYAGQLLAQDELQVLECVELASLREYLSTAINSVGSQTIGTDSQTGRTIPTPILISNIERALQLDVANIYGNAFSKASPEELEKAFKRLEPPPRVNLIAIEAPKYGEGVYTNEQIMFILRTCYTGFMAARILAKKTFAMNRNQKKNEPPTSRSAVHRVKTIIHTGWWGCGAYGNNRHIMLITQIVAAHWSQVDRIIFHLQDKKYEAIVKEVGKQVEHLLKITDVQQVVNEIQKFGYEWDKSNDT